LSNIMIVIYFFFDVTNLYRMIDDCKRFAFQKCFNIVSKVF